MESVQKAFHQMDDNSSRVRKSSSESMHENDLQNKKKQLINITPFPNKHNQPIKQTYGSKNQNISHEELLRKSQRYKLLKSNHVVKSSITTSMPLPSTKPNSASISSSLRTRSKKSLKVIGGKHNDLKESTNTVQEKSQSHTTIQSVDGNKRARNASHMPNSSIKILAGKSMPEVVFPNKHHEKLKKQSTLSHTSQAKISGKGSLVNVQSTKENVFHSIGNNSTGVERLQGAKDILNNTAGKKMYECTDKKAAEYQDVGDSEDYESDFQECTDSDESQIVEELEEVGENFGQADSIVSTIQKKREIACNFESSYKVEEEHMLDSGHYDLAEARKKAAKKESITSTTLSPVQTHNLSDRSEKFSENKFLSLYTDEGFEDERRSGDFTKSSTPIQIRYVDSPKSVNSLVSSKKAFKKPNRGQQLLEMIRLDEMEWSLLECVPIVYEDFIRSYGKLNTRQVTTQTAEDNIHSKVQTDEIICINKWTQFPVTCRKILSVKEDLYSFQTEQLGVGTDVYTTEISTLMKPHYFDILRLNDFLDQSGKVILPLLETHTFGENVRQGDAHGLLFSEGSVKLHTNSVTFLSGRSIMLLSYSETSSKSLLTIHSPDNDKYAYSSLKGVERMNKENYILSCCIGCVWNILEPSVPSKLFYSSNSITACCFHPVLEDIVFAGLDDGSINLWDLKEDEQWHWKIPDEANQTNWVIRSPTYTTAANSDTNAVHHSKISSIKVLSKIHENNVLTSQHNHFIIIQICSLDEEGHVMVWTVSRNLNSSIKDSGLAYWGTMRLLQSQDVVLLSAFKNNSACVGRYVDLDVDSTNSDNLYVATNTTQVLHVTCIGNKTVPLVYTENEMGLCGNTTCIETCPFKRPYFLVGCDDGTIRLHTLNAVLPLIQVKDGYCAEKIKILQWSRSRPFVIYALDDASRIHVWNFGISDVRPILTVSTEKLGYANSIQLSNWNTEGDMHYQYLALGTKTGDVWVHKLKLDFHYGTKDDLMQELTTFMRYVTLLRC